MLGLTAGPGGCAGNSAGGTRNGSPFSGVVRWLPGYRRQRSVTPGYSRYRRAETWKSSRSTLTGGHVSGSASCVVRNIVLFPAGHFIALQPRPQLTCSVVPFPTVICSAATQVSLRFSAVVSVTLAGGKWRWKKSSIHYECNVSW